MGVVILNAMKHEFHAAERKATRTRRAVRRSGVRVTGRRPLTSSVHQNPQMTPTSSEAGSNGFDLDRDDVPNLRRGFFNFDPGADVDTRGFKPEWMVTQEIWSVRCGSASLRNENWYKYLGGAL
jgi:hypothetical protein